MIMEGAHSAHPVCQVRLRGAHPEREAGWEAQELPLPPKQLVRALVSKAERPQSEHVY